ncbi:MAG: 50S ribosomal protein L11 methyltransferase [Acidobacteriota bacterium]
MKTEPSLSLRSFSRLTVPRRGGDDLVVGVLSLFSPLGFVEEGKDLVACFRESAGALRAAAALTARGIRSELVTDIAEGDPLEAFRAASRPFAVGERFWIDPGDPSDSVAPAGKIALRLPASRAFGTGGHESTRLALLALADEPPDGLRVLDVGTGSGVLALAAAALGARRAVGLDQDADAVFVARENLRRHEFGTRVGLVAGPISAVTARFPLVVANMLPEEIFEIRRHVVSLVDPGGRLILSGIPREREAEVVGRFRSSQFALGGRRAENEWVCVCLDRAS